MKRLFIKLIISKSIGNKFIGEDILTFYNRYPKSKIIEDWLFKTNEYGIIYKKRWKLIKLLSNLLPNKI